MVRRIRLRTTIQAAVLTALLFWSAPASAQKFYPDDPLAAEPPAVPTLVPKARSLSSALELIKSVLGRPGERQPVGGAIPAGGVNTMDEVMDGPWFVNRHGRDRLTSSQLAAGAGTDHPPMTDGPWSIISLHPYGVRQGIIASDGRKGVYVLRFDPPGHAEMSTGAEMVSSRLLYAAGYHVPEEYLVSLTREQLVIGPGANILSSAGNRRALRSDDLARYLRTVARRPDGRYRAAAMYVPASWQQGLLGPYQVFGTRSDDPNDLVPHEHRREQRGLFLVCAWVNHSLMRAAHTFDVWSDDWGTPQIRHFLLDFVATLGSGYREPKRVQEGNESLLKPDSAIKSIVTLGARLPAWARASYPDLPSVGHFEYETFDPERWAPFEETAPFVNRLPDDDYWAARLIMSFSDDDVRTLVSAGGYSDPKAVEWITRCLIERRNRIGRVYFEKVLPFDRFRIENGALAYDDLAVVHGFRPAPHAAGVRWARLDNASGVLTRLQLLNPTLALPQALTSAGSGEYFAAILSGADESKDVTVYVRTNAGRSPDVVGVERGWPGRKIVKPAAHPRDDVNRFATLDKDQQQLYEPYAKASMAASGRSMSVAEHFDGLSISERTTFYAITHGAMHQPLTDRNGAPLGRVFDFITGIERIAGQYDGKGGDEQFRLYVTLKPEAIETIAKSREFVHSHENTVYHVGYPHSYRLEGKEPSMQVSYSEDQLHADIDIDYRSSKSPQSLFNGHLTASNSDVRAGENSTLHNGRWSGLVAWWKDVFGGLSDVVTSIGGLMGFSDAEVPTPTPPDRAPGTPIADVQDAVQEMLTDWLVRHDIDGALSLVSPRAYACLNVDDAGAARQLDPRTARQKLAEIMRLAATELGPRSSLTAAIVGVKPVIPGRTVLTHPYEREFVLVEATASAVSEYLCGSPPPQAGTTRYVGAIFRFRQEGSAVLGLLLSQEENTWRVVSYRVFEQ